MVGRCLAGIGRVIVAILKAIAWLLLNALQLVLNVAKVFLLLLGLVGRLFHCICKSRNTIGRRRQL